ncbi:hypothetical protein [Scopulibacillus cellulosilyticus]|uniref:Uncharacterized protein n=1 Tax=Scopulibacillus cellulosilyticus TaxID=2665665 RepID=A0ABW2PY63_9BACL
MSTVGSANIQITADDSQARKTVKGFFGFLNGIGTDHKMVKLFGNSKGKLIMY